MSVASDKLLVRSRRALRRQRQRGAAALEFALVLPLLIVLLLGMIDFADLWFTYSTMNQAAREAARVGSLHPSSTRTTMAEKAASNYLTPAGLISPCRRVCATTTMSVESADTFVVQIKLEGAYKNISGFSYGLFGSANPFASLTNLTVESRMRLENPL